MLKSHGQDYLVGNKLSRADIHLVELLYYVEELDPSLLANFPLLKVSAPTALEARHTPTWHLLSGPWDWGARVPIPVQASLPPGLLSSLQGPGLECGKNLSSQGHQRWTLPHGKHPAFYQERDPGLAVSSSLFHFSLCPDFLFPPLCPACVLLSLSLSEWVSPHLTSSLQFLFLLSHVDFSLPVSLSEGRLAPTDLTHDLSCFPSSVPAPCPSSSCLDIWSLNLC